MDFYMENSLECSGNVLTDIGVRKFRSQSCPRNNLLEIIFYDHHFIHL